MAGLAPLLHAVWNLAGGDRPAVDGADDQVGRSPVLGGFFAVGRDAFVEVGKLVAETTDGARGQVAQVGVGRAGVLVTDSGLTGE